MPFFFDDDNRDLLMNQETRHGASADP
jgi:hypothetical protein